MGEKIPLSNINQKAGGTTPPAFFISTNERKQCNQLSITATVARTKFAGPPSNRVTGGYVVNFAYGRRGSTLATGTKTTRPVYYAAARLIYDKLVREKMAKGYTLGADSRDQLKFRREEVAA